MEHTFDLDRGDRGIDYFKTCAAITILEQERKDAREAGRGIGIALRRRPAQNEDAVRSIFLFGGKSE